MKDNRPLECKQTKQERQEYHDAVEDWEGENGALPKLGRSGMTRSKTNSYTGEPWKESEIKNG